MIIYLQWQAELMERNVNNYIQSGQAFLVQTVPTGGSTGTVTFDESAKAGGSSNVLFTTPSPVTSTVQLLHTSLYQLNTDGSEVPVDGAVERFNDSYSNAIDGMDARKSMNSAENLSIKTAGKLLVVESRHTITQQDTIFFNLTGTAPAAIVSILMQRTWIHRCRATW